MPVLELSAMMASLAADWMTTRRDDAESKDAAAFQRWLRDEVFPRIEAQASQIFLSTVRLRAEQREQFDQLLSHLFEIKKILGAKTAADTWRELSNNERAILDASYEDEWQGDRGRASSNALIRTLGRTAVRQAAKFLIEEGCLREHEASNGFYEISITATGAVLVMEVRDPALFAEQCRDVARALPSDRSMRSLAQIAAEASVSLIRCRLIVESWREAGYLALQDLYPVELSRVIDVKEALRRRYSPD